LREGSFWGGEESATNPGGRARDNILAVPITDTAPSAQAIQLQVQRAMSGEQRRLMAFEMSMFAWELARERTRRKQPEWPETQAARDLMRLEFLPKPMPAACDERSEGFQKY